MAKSKVGDHYDLTPYPTQLGGSVKVVIDKLRGAEVDTGELVHGAWHVVGFGLGQAHVHAAAGSPAKCDPDEGRALTAASVADKLEAAAAGRIEAEAGAGGWMAILSFLLPLLQQWLQNR